MLIRKKKVKKKKRKGKAEHKEENEENKVNGITGETEETQEEKKETPAETFQTKLDALKSEKEEEINRLQEELKEFENRKTGILQSERPIKGRYEDLLRQQNELTDHNKDLETRVIQEHKTAKILERSEKIDTLVTEENTIDTHISTINNNW